MVANCYPDEHVFLLGCSSSGDFNGQVKVCFEKNDENLALSLSEELEKLSNSLNQLNNVQPFMQSLDPDTLNYIFDNNFLQRYRSVNKFIKNIDDVRFESLCAYYVSLLGCSDFRVTRRSSDQGLDFYGTLPFNKYSFFGPVSEKSFLIGQAKLYTSKVGTSEIREFVGSIELLRRRIYSSETYAYQFATELKHYTLINPIFISSSSFTKDAVTICQKVGIRMIDIVKLITLLTSVKDIFDGNNELKDSVFYQEILRIKIAES
ncbi:hypothetical protein BCS42_01130 [Crenothrix sp. D3]|jgi:hypothetical protein|nr:hypothetical protein BCS42_01130 [Crenothrix sp. D3]